MIGLDTNVLVRYIMQDDRKQAAQATRLIESLTAASPGYITVVSVIELVWVLGSAFALSREQVAAVLADLMVIDVFKLERVAVVAAAWRMFRDGKADFADCVIERSSTHGGCERTMTFDRAAAKTAGMVLIK
jgi:predicted nucleic-acid-binding protein